MTPCFVASARDEPAIMTVALLQCTLQGARAERHLQHKHAVPACRMAITKCVDVSTQAINVVLSCCVICMLLSPPDTDKQAASRAASVHSHAV